LENLLVDDQVSRQRRLHTVSFNDLSGSRLGAVDCVSAEDKPDAEEAAEKLLKAHGLGDMVPTFLSPAKPSTLIWGIRPAFQLPTAANFDTENSAWDRRLSY